MTLGPHRRASRSQQRADRRVSRRSVRLHVSWRVQSCRRARCRKRPCADRRTWLPQAKAICLGSENLTWQQIHTAIAELAGVAPPRLGTQSDTHVSCRNGGRTARIGCDGRAPLSTREQAAMVGRYYWYSHRKAAALGYAPVPARTALIETTLLACRVTARLARGQSRHASCCRHLPLPRRCPGRTGLKTFRSLVVLKRPHAALWTIMRDHLVDIVAAHCGYRGNPSARPERRCGRHGAYREPVARSPSGSAGDPFDPEDRRSRAGSIGTHGMRARSPVPGRSNPTS